MRFLNRRGSEHGAALFVVEFVQNLLGALGDDFLRSIEGFVWRKYLSFAEINDATRNKLKEKFGQ